MKSEIAERVKTSEEKWLEKAIYLYSQKQPFHFIDDIGLGFTENDLRSAIDLIHAVKKHKLMTWKQVSAILISLGLSGAGLWLIGVAVADPEPTSKLSLLVGGGVILALTGGMGALAALNIKFSVKARSKGYSFEIKPE